MGLNAYFAYNVVLTDGIPWQEALTSVFIAGWMFVVLSVLGLRTIMLKFIPPGIQLAMGAGIGTLESREEPNQSIHQPINHSAITNRCVRLF